MSCISLAAGSDVVCVVMIASCTMHDFCMIMHMNKPIRRIKESLKKVRVLLNVVKVLGIIVTTYSPVTGILRYIARIIAATKLYLPEIVWMSFVNHGGHSLTGPLS